jgi:hypothetical protein
MKKKLYILSTLLLTAAVLSLSSCLKDDSRYTDFSKSTPVVEFNLGGLAYFGPDAITESGDTVVKQFAVSVAASSLPKTATTITLAVDNSLITSYLASNSVVPYLPFPAGSYVLNNPTITIPAGQNVAVVSVTFYKSKIDPTLSYMLPVKIASTTGGYTISGNMGVHYYHFIGNDFAGSYTQNYQRYNGAADSTSNPNIGSSGIQTSFAPVTPSEFTVYSGYSAGAQLRYDVTFTKTGTGAAAKYSDFQVSFVSSDVTNFTGVTIVQQPVFFNPATGKPATADLPGPYTYAQAVKIFHFQFVAQTSAPRYIIDTYVKNP